MPTINCAPFFNFRHFVSQLTTAMFLVCKFQDYKRQHSISEEENKKRVTEKELTHLNHKIDKLLIKLEEENDPEMAASPEEECVICISAKATMQTFPCGHRVVCRKCFVKTIQMAVSQRMLPLRCVICRSKILRLKQTTTGGLNTGYVIRNSRSYTNNNPFYLSPANSPVSPVTEVFREQRAVFVKHYDQFGYSSNGQSPVASPNGTFSKVSQSRRSNCVLHKHCGDKSKVNSPNQSPSSSSSPSSPSTSIPSTSRGSLLKRLPRTMDDHEGGAFQWQFNRKRKYRARRGLRRRHGNPSGRPNSLLLPIDETDELQELLSPSVSHVNSNIRGESSSPTSASSSTVSIDAKITKANDNSTPETNDKCQSPPLGFASTQTKPKTPKTPLSAQSSSKLSTTIQRAKGWIKRAKRGQRSE